MANRNVSSAIVEHICERPSLDKIPSALHSLLQHAWDGDVAQRRTMSEVRRELDLAREDLGFSKVLQKPTHTRKRSRKRSANVDSLLYGRAESLEIDNNSCLESRKGAPSMTGDDFESYFVTSNMTAVNE